MPSPPRVLALHAHPDDLEIQCGGTLALLRRAGCPLVMATMTPGDCGSAERPADEIAAIRRREAAESAALLGAEYLCLEFRDLAIIDDDASRRRVVEAIRRARPDLVLAPPAEDYMPDHEATHRLVRDALFAAPIPNYRTTQWDPAPPLARIPHLYLVDPVGGVDRRGRRVVPDFHVDIAEVWATKRAMLACHESQRDWLRRQHGLDEYLESMERWTAARGAEVGVRYAEGFVRYVGHPYPHDDLLAEVLGPIARGGPRVGS